MLEWPDTAGTAQGLVDGPAGALQVAISRPDAQSRGLALVCHPHPQHGGTKDNKVVTMLARAANEAGFAAVRFNFRGVGESQGEYDRGRGETDDARAVLDWALSASGAPLRLIAGFSFGAAVALRLAGDNPPPALVTVGLPVEYFESALPWPGPRPDTRWLALYGSEDDVIDARGAIQTLRALEPRPQITVMEGAGHFLHGRLTELRTHVKRFLSEQESI